MKNLLVLLLAVVTICGAVGWLLLIGATYDFQKEVETLKAEKAYLWEKTSKKAVEEAGYRLSCHQLSSRGDTVCDVYTASTREFCWWEEACRGRSLKHDRIKEKEGCVGYFVCSNDPQRVHTPPGPEVDENTSQSESDLHPMGK